ncbi:MAG: helix-turn-helix domain-containing protein [Brevundimonas sp.]|uniref:TetR/AcrR family transcriptional regulator n=1 Tax=Brevundimonas sp. TaxID=1871086 RepID=UPI002733E8CD|nr:TetR/AcrR family transcriptional regulator [Brevundimonas sp.]MDP3404124.1 helix-turn-helix domain-containing protein [Brevundimonas sp.]
MADSADDQPSVDGRRVRSERSRFAIARALLDLVRETRQMPTMDAVADRANVSRRSVFRHFADTNELIIAATHMQRDEVFARFHSRDISQMPEPERVKAVAQRLGRLWEYVTPARAVAGAMRADNPVIDRMLSEDDVTHSSYLNAMFSASLAQAPDADRPLFLQSLVSASSWPTWVGLRRDQHLTVVEARRVMEHTLRALLQAARSASPDPVG